MAPPATSGSPRVARLTAAQVHAMLAAGILRDSEPLELIDGVLVYKDRSATGADPMTIGEKHNMVVQLLSDLTAELRPHDAYLQVQGPVRLSEHDEPEPDGAVVRGDRRDYLEQLPSAGDVAAVIEVADSSLEDDRTTKAALYAQAGIAQYVLVNVRDGEIEIYEAPARGRYTSTRTVARNGRFELRVSGEVTLSLVAARFLP